MAGDPREFGDALRRARTNQHLTQAQLVTLLGGSVARSTLANIEVGRERPSQRLWTAIQRHWPEGQTHLAEAYERSRARGAGSTDRPSIEIGAEGGLGGPFRLERLDLAYIFRESHSPEEIVELRTVRALRSGAGQFRLKMKHTTGVGFVTSPEVLWGGALVDETRTDAAGQSIYLRTIRFPRPLRRGERHTFALRSWVERDPEPDTQISAVLTIPADTVAIHAAFLSDLPGSAWQYGPLADAALAPRSADEALARPVTVDAAGGCSAVFDHPPLGTDFGLCWSWGSA